MTTSVFGRLHDRLNKFDAAVSVQDVKLSVEIDETSRSMTGLMNSCVALSQSIDMICQDFDELLKQVAQSPSGRPPDIFYDLCLKLFDRVFGENATLCECQPGTHQSANSTTYAKTIRSIID